jgi:hypothetical protein
MPSLATRLGGRRGVFFDTSVWSPADLMACFTLVPPQQLLYASDFPYNQQPASLLLAVRAARLAGASDSVLRAILYENAAALADGASLPEPDRPLARAACIQVPALARALQYLSMSIALYWTDQADRVGTLDLAISATDPDAAAQESFRRINRLLVTARDLWTALPAIDEAEHYAADRMLSRLLHLAAVACATDGAFAAGHKSCE